MTSIEEVKPLYPSANGRVISSGNGIWNKPMIDVTTSRTGVTSDPSYYSDLFEFCLSADVKFWWKGRVPEKMDPRTRLYSTRELEKQEAKAKRKQKKGTVL